MQCKLDKREKLLLNVMQIVATIIHCVPDYLLVVTIQNDLKRKYTNKNLIKNKSIIYIKNIPNQEVPMNTRIYCPLRRIQQLVDTTKRKKEKKKTISIPVSLKQSAMAGRIDPTRDSSILCWFSSLNNENCVKQQTTISTFHIQNSHPIFVCLLPTIP